MSTKQKERGKEKSRTGKKTVEITLFQAHEMYESVRKLKELDLDTIPKLRMSQNIRELRSQSELYTESVRDLMKKYCEIDAGGNFVKKFGDLIFSDREAYEKEVKKLKEDKVEVVLHPISYKEFGKQFKADEELLAVLLDYIIEIDGLDNNIHE